MAPESKILVTWFKLIYWGRAGLNSASFSEWVWRTLKLTVKRLKVFHTSVFYNHYIVPNYTCSPSSCSVCQPSRPLQSVYLMELLQTDVSPSLDRGEQLPNCICAVKRFFTSRLIFKWDFLADWYRIDNETKGWRLQRKNNFEEVDLHVNLKSKKLSLCSRLGRGEVYDCEMSLFCMPSGEKVYAIDARSTKCGKKVRVWSFFWIAEY